MERSNTLLALRLSALRRLPATSWALAFGWILLFGAYAIASLTVKHGPHLTAFGDIGMCLVALFASLGLLLNVTSQNRRIRAFWLLLAAGCAAWFFGQLIWTYFEVVLRQEVPNPFVGDVIIFLHPVPMIAALALKPHDQRDDLGAHIGYLDFSLLLVWWVFLYTYAVIPWQYVAPNLVAYGVSYDNLAAAENLLLVLGFATLLAKSRGAWREIYSHLFQRGTTLRCWLLHHEPRHRCSALLHRQPHRSPADRFFCVVRDGRNRWFSAEAQAGRNTGRERRANHVGRPGL